MILAQPGMEAGQAFILSSRWAQMEFLNDTGCFDPETGAFELHQAKECGDGDLLNFAAIWTMMNGRTVYVAKSKEMPSRSLFAAIYR